jgi:hypothetical protein
MNYDFKNKEEKKKANEIVVKLDQDDSGIVGSINKMEIALSNALVELQSKIESLNLTTNVTTEKHEHTIETKDIDVKPIIKAIEDSKTEVSVEKFDDSNQLTKLEGIKNEVQLLASQIDSFRKAQVQVPVQKAGKKTDASEYVPVRLTDGKRFYRAIEEIATAIGASQSAGHDVVNKYYSNSGAVTDGVVWSPLSNKRWHVVSMYLQISSDATITLEDVRATGDSIVWKGAFVANQGMTVNFSELYPLVGSENGSDLVVTTTAGDVYITVTGYEI